MPRLKRKKKTELLNDTTYLLCPDKTCKLFWDVTRYTPCESNCPMQDRLIKIIICQRCREVVELRGNHFSWDRVDHDCPDGGGCMNFQRMSGKYELLYEKPI